MHTLTKIRLFRIILWVTYPVACIFLYPFTLLKRKNKESLFFFLDRYAMGGAQRVHIDILNSVAGRYKQVYFTRRSLDDAMKHEFYSLPNTACKDIHFWCDNLAFRIFSIHYFAFYVNRHKHAQVFSSNSTYFYDMLPFFGKSIVKSELLHNFTYGKKGMEFFGLGNYKYLDNRLCVDYYTAENIKNQYKQYHIPDVYFNRVQVIEPGVIIPQSYNKNITYQIHVLYAGRGGAQKRIWLIDRIAKHCIEQQLPVTFHFAGVMIDELSPFVKQHSVLHGEIREKEKMNQLYEQVHVLLMTSAFEGFPMFIKEGMAYGCIPLVTALEGNKTHLRHLQNALLIQAVVDEDKVVEEGIANLQQLVMDKALCSELSLAAYDYAKTYFPRKRFTTAYQNFFGTAAANG